MKLIIVSCIIVLISSCNASKKGNNSKQDMFTPSFAPGPPTMVYKTKVEVSQLVPVMLNDDKTEVIAYPSKNDLKIGDAFRKPIALNDNWFLDEKGIGPNVAFLNMTYEEFFALDSVPTKDTLFGLIEHIDPIEKMCDCGNRNSFEDAAKKLNELIDLGNIEDICKVVR